ncbi:hypothetical protein [Aliivibrio fischeri]|uniref:hypothetical protein n=1 Tax=Aliivibrio fischeri TaxID=668 RepID=UPI0007C590DB|nr:hypothetical protein [Aliivibrio fischeri]
MQETDIIAEANQTLRINLNTVICKLGDRNGFGITAIQRVCKLGYNQACRVVELGIKENLLYRPNNDYKIAFTDKANKLRKQILLSKSSLPENHGSIELTESKMTMNRGNDENIK